MPTIIRLKFPHGAGATSFAIYGFLRKIAPVGSLIGTSVETGLLLPKAVLFAAGAAPQLTGALPPQDFGNYALLALAGPVTALPLLWFASGARRLPMAAVGHE